MASLEQAHGRHRAEDPRQLGDLGQVGLKEESRPLRVQAEREKISQYGRAQRPQLPTVTDRRHGVVVGDEEVTFVLVLHLQVLSYGTEVVAQVQLSGRLNA